MNKRSGEAHDFGQPLSFNPGSRKRRRRSRVSKHHPSDRGSIYSKNQHVIDSLYGGRQCSNCDKRFRANETAQYNQHLDWHFQQNRQRRDNKNRFSRSWFTSKSHWIENKDEPATQLIRDIKVSPTFSEPAPVSSVRCPLGMKKTRCEGCHDYFDHFFNHDDDEFHLKSAIKYDDMYFHTICFQDFNKTK